MSRADKEFSQICCVIPGNLTESRRKFYGIFRIILITGGTNGGIVKMNSMSDLIEIINLTKCCQLLFNGVSAGDPPVAVQPSFKITGGKEKIAHLLTVTFVRG
jgi:hypothetical protein